MNFFGNLRPSRDRRRERYGKAALATATANAATVDLEEAERAMGFPRDVDARASADAPARLDRLPEPQRTPATTEVLDPSSFSGGPGPSLGHAQAARSMRLPRASVGDKHRSPGSARREVQAASPQGTDRKTKRAMRIAPPRLPTYWRPAAVLVELTFSRPSAAKSTITSAMRRAAASPMTMRSALIFRHQLSARYMGPTTVAER